MEKKTNQLGIGKRMEIQWDLITRGRNIINQLINYLVIRNAESQRWLLYKDFADIENKPEPLTAPFWSSMGLASTLLEDAEEVAFKRGTISKMSSPPKVLNSTLNGQTQKDSWQENWKDTKREREREN